ncbi:monovalent cation/H+ antiporter subunit A [Chitinimonas sp. BJB300]|uniref:monovalent cation/H+ antiporter subunit A n=1 Tax=Chitinimonas sp. BJB300 TaxID=1559339 RepID=UPI000C0ED922|nr:monovalent cation/H+ antiporter subunit A [Chitinimonas sp. BJB300]PHV12320.1 monovalent cation/H+ antiporter subunit A [Chitinimonas sp. BJB300]TSJ90943.1 monovalent cation/H+ antiporter subunit A [Chitinimonas sp. BJB300]
MNLLLLAALPFIGAALMSFVPNVARRNAAWLAGGTALGALALLLSTAPTVFGGDVLRWSVPWVPQLGLELGFRMDGLAWLFALLITGIGALVVLYAAHYLSKSDPPARFFLFLLLFMGAMLGMVIADNLILLVVFWELTSLSSFLLIGYWQKEPAARSGARMALTITGAGGLALLGGALLLGHIVGSYSLDAVLASGEQIRAHPLYLPALLLVLLGAFTKSAQFPFHFWLPNAMAAPTPVSAYLHSATMVKAGVFLLARLYPALGHSEPWFWIVSTTGLATMLIGAYVALFKHDLKGLLAYSTISHLGLITLLLGLDQPLAIVAAVFHILNHACFKASLFMSAGIVDHETGTRDMRNLNHLMRFMPITGTLTMLASAAMAGVPLFNGFLSKEMFLAQTIRPDLPTLAQWALPIGATLGALCSVAYSVRFVHDTFFNNPRSTVVAKTQPHEPAWGMRLPVELLVLVCLVVGVLPALTIGPLLAIGAQATLHGGPYAALPDYSLALWHGFNLPLMLSAIALFGGVALYFLWQSRVNLHTLERTPMLGRVNGRGGFERGINALVRGARWLTAVLQNGSLQRYLLCFVVITILAGLAPYLLNGWLPMGHMPSATPVSPAFVAVWLIGMVCTVSVVLHFGQRLLTLILLGAVGLTVTLTFVYFSAPDLAMTQLSVEVVTTILMMLALNWLPKDSKPEGQAWRKWRDGLVASAAGLGVTGIVYAVLTRPFDSIAPFYLQNAPALGGGANAVNVIIVDFRGYDTLGEITVLGIAALIISALLRDFVPVDYTPQPGEPTRDKHPLMLAMVARMLLPLAVLVALYIYMRGHNQPGGGFVAGLVLAIALILQYVANGQRWMAMRSSGDFRPWIAAGLLIAGMTGMGSWLLGAPFLTSSYDYPLIPLFGHVPITSAMFFDLGVMLTVTGATMLMLAAIARLTAGAEKPLWK